MATNPKFDRWNASETELRERLRVTEVALEILAAAVKSANARQTHLGECIVLELSEAETVLNSSGIVRGAEIMVPTEHEKSEWRRMANAAIAVGRHEIGRRFAEVASMHAGEAMPIARFDALQTEYRGWLVFGEWGATEAKANATDTR